MGTLYIVSTPIGNLSDISIRAIETLFSVDIIACEDTRRAGLLLAELNKHYGLAPEFTFRVQRIDTSPRLLRYDDRTEQNVTPQLLEALSEGKSVALISDAGTPLISDPGYVLVHEARKRNIPVVSIPGASALLAALTSSGLPADKFMFLGYPPEKKGHRKKLFTNLLQMNRFIDSTYVFYVAPHKLHTTLTDLKETLGDIKVTICRELTKIHEEIWNGIISEALQKCIHVKGEIVLLIRS